MKGFEGIGFEVAPSRLMRTGQIVTGDFEPGTECATAADFAETRWQTLSDTSRQLQLGCSPYGREMEHMLLLEHLWYFIRIRSDDFVPIAD
jgi:hypothetical protein